MFHTVSICPCCQEIGVEPDYELELSEPKYVVAECHQCAMADQDLEEFFEEERKEGKYWEHSIVPEFESWLTETPLPF